MFYNICVFVTENLEGCLTNEQSTQWYLQKLVYKSKTPCDLQSTISNGLKSYQNLQGLRHFSSSTDYSQIIGKIYNIYKNINAWSETRKLRIRV